MCHGLSLMAAEEAANLAADLPGQSPLGLCQLGPHQETANDEDDAQTAA
jgi:hypothetical protein